MKQTVDGISGLADKEIDEFKSGTTNITLWHNVPNNNGASIVANCLIQNAPLKQVEISGAELLSHNGWRAICAALETNSNCKLETLTLRANRIDETALHSLSSALRRHFSTLKNLILFMGIRDMTIAGWHCLFQTLQDHHCRLEKLNLSSIGISDEVAAALANTLSNNSMQRELHLSGNRNVTTTAWVAFSIVLRNFQFSIGVSGHW